MLENEYLICIDDVTDILNFGKDKTPELAYGKTYYVEFYKPHEDGRQYVRLKNERNVWNDYLITRFVTKEEFRNIKIEKLLSDD